MVSAMRPVLCVLEAQFSKDMTDGFNLDSMFSRFIFRHEDLRCRCFRYCDFCHTFSQKVISTKGFFLPKLNDRMR